MKELTSPFFKTDTSGRLRKCLNFDPFHITPLTRDPVVFFIREALRVLDGVVIDSKVESLNFYGPLTAAAVKEYKRKRGIIRPGQPLDDIVGTGTVDRMDQELAGKQQVIPPPPPPPSDEFQFTNMRGAALVIKKADDDPSKGDLENAPVERKLAKIKAFGLNGGGLLLPPTEAVCRFSLLNIISVGGPEAKEVAEFFFTNATRALLRSMPSFWATRVASDKSFTANHARQSAAIQAALRFLAKQNSARPNVIDINRLQDGASQPPPLRIFANNIDFSFQRDPARLIRKDPLAFGIGSIQGLTVSIVEFKGSPDGKFAGKLKYELVDHFGADDADVIDPGQASLWTLQRKMATGQSSGGFEPYRPKIDVTAPFSGFIA